MNDFKKLNDEQKANIYGSGFISIISAIVPLVLNIANGITSMIKLAYANKGSTKFGSNASISFDNETKTKITEIILPF
ncbi:hypothetical protein [Mycoplasma phocimorsus]|uniref:Uncharacterized protein n=1 Tax=Mycoplasma phocimorsus TaxID=3045839 RepID=A0AAJ1PSQ0_9MOLU|nr:hypothetical protein [Mycoplasma phocimorsus]MDJ1646028.1 hypothetical protein [Mycoplasma phocimorsus]MDJ1646309.1 hypothetical protein [Mycoplasma phocimorsus]MDJ1646914.1 hypothetical protein [Mycoplasma phocimorsus]MDJ1647881.1 hypothetical protein [Mycoplasma phocimorsus]MDJ1648419.1 hypothetical protein [Mycoplasma phocimorsus]